MRVSNRIITSSDVSCEDAPTGRIRQAPAVQTGAQSHYSTGVIPQSDDSIKQQKLHVINTHATLRAEAGRVRQAPAVQTGAQAANRPARGGALREVNILGGAVFNFIKYIMCLGIVYKST